MKAAISYQLWIHVERPVRIRVGRLGSFLFPAGHYVYTGSAKRNLEARIARHLQDEKTAHWHIDWLLCASGVKLASVTRSSVGECMLNRKTADSVVVPGFGASDCRKGCGSHLRYLAGWEAEQPLVPHKRSRRTQQQTQV